MQPFLDLKQVNARHQAAIEQALLRVARSGWYLRGEETQQFETSYARYVGSAYAIGCGNGLDALTLILQAYIQLGVMAPGDEIIVPANTYIASVLAITRNGLRPVLVEPNERTCQLDERLVETAIGPHTRGMMLVHLYGRCAYTEHIGQLCRQYGLKLIEDNAQAHGCRYCGPRIGTEAQEMRSSSRQSPSSAPRTGSLGDAAGHSFYPGKNLGALGDAGAVTTNDPRLAEVVRALGNYGYQKKYVCEYQGENSRIDELQAAVLAAKLPFIDQENALRRAVARIYEAQLSRRYLRVPSVAPEGENVYHIFPIFSPYRDALQQHLHSLGIETLIHYPIPPHRQRCYEAWAQLSLPVTEKMHLEELSLPISPVMTEADAARVVEAVNSFRPQ